VFRWLASSMTALSWIQNTALTVYYYLLVEVLDVDEFKLQLLVDTR